MNKLTRQNGFTLFELLVGITIMMILVAIAVPQLNQTIDSYKLSGAARIVWSDLNDAKMRAIRTNQSITVTFTNSTTYNYSRGDGTTFTRNLEDEYSDITVSMNGGGTVTFNSRGLTSVTSRTVTITSSISGKGKWFTIIWTGRIGEITNV